MDNLTLHTYGDSHAAKYGSWDKINISGLNIKINHLGGKLMFSFGRDKLNVVNNVANGDMVCFCFGEIDCRCHINKYEPDWQKNVDLLVEKYFANIVENVKKCENITVFVYNVVPPLERELDINKWVEIGNELPSLGTDEDRKKYTNYMNIKLKENCVKHNFIFFDVYNKYANDKGFLNQEYSDGNCHINNPIYMKEFLMDFLKMK